MSKVVKIEGRRVLKVDIVPEIYRDITGFGKSYMIVKDTRAFMEGDLLILREYDPGEYEIIRDYYYTYRAILVEVCHKTCGSSKIGMDAEWCVLGIKYIAEDKYEEKIMEDRDTSIMKFIERCKEKAGKTESMYRPDNEELIVG